MTAHLDGNLAGYFDRLQVAYKSLRDKRLDLYYSHTFLCNTYAFFPLPDADRQSDEKGLILLEDDIKFINSNKLLNPKQINRIISRDFSVHPFTSFEGWWFSPDVLERASKKLASIETVTATD